MKLFVFAGFLSLIVTVLVHGASKDEVQQKLEEARANLRVSQAIEMRVSSELERLKKADTVTPEIIKDYEIYLDRIQAMVSENQKMVDRMQKAYAGYQQSAKTTGCSHSIQSKEDPYEEVPTGDEPDELAVLDRELNDSLAEFDEMLLKELDDIRAKSENKMKSIRDAAADAAKRLQEKGVDVDSSGDEGTEEDGEESPSEEGREAREPGDDEPEQGKSYSDVPVTERRDDGSLSDADRGKRDKQTDGSMQDDDIVARQLREAAEKETDPELKKKLWKEYEDYKKGSL